MFITADQRICGSTISTLIKTLHARPTLQFCSGHSKKGLVFLRILSSCVPNTLSFMLLAMCFSCLMNSLWRKHGQCKSEPFNTPFTFTNWSLYRFFLSKFRISTKIYHNNRSSFRSYWNWVMFKLLFVGSWNSVKQWMCKEKHTDGWCCQ